MAQRDAVRGDRKQITCFLDSTKATAHDAIIQKARDGGLPNRQARSVNYIFNWWKSRRTSSGLVFVCRQKSQRIGWCSQRRRDLFIFGNAIASIMALQSRLKSNHQRRSNTPTERTDCPILRTTPKDTRRHFAKEIESKKRFIQRILPHFHERRSARIDVPRELTGSWFRVSRVSACFLAERIRLLCAVDGGSFSGLEPARESGGAVKTVTGFGFLSVMMGSAGPEEPAIKSSYNVRSLCFCSVAGGAGFKSFKKGDTFEPSLGIELASHSRAEIGVLISVLSGGHSTATNAGILSTEATHDSSCKFASSAANGRAERFTIIDRMVFDASRAKTGSATAKWEAGR